MFCPNCGTEVRDEARFCPMCGTRLEAATGSADAHVAESVSASGGSNTGTAVDGVAAARRRSRKQIPLVLLVILLVLAVAATAFAAYAVYRTVIAPQQEEPQQGEAWAQGSQAEEEQSSDLEAYTVHGDGWSFVMPEYWRGKVEAETVEQPSGSERSVVWFHSDSCPDFPVLEIDVENHYTDFLYPLDKRGETVDGTELQIGGFEDNGVAGRAVLDDGRTLWVWVQSPDNWYWDTDDYSAQEQETYIAEAWKLLTMGETSAPLDSLPDGSLYSDYMQPQAATIQELAGCLTIEQ